MNGYGYCKAKDKDTGRWVEGYYACLPYTIYCFKEDYDANPDNDREYVVSTRMTDWCLPNQPILTEIEKGSAKRYIGTDKNGRKVFDGDAVKFTLKYFGGTMPIIVHIGYFDWKPQVRKDLGKTMWYEERKLWLCEGELVEEE